MFRTALIPTTLALLLAGGAYAQTAHAQTATTTPAEPTQMDTGMATQPAPNVKQADGYLASALIGKTVYNGMGDDAESIGSISDLILSPDAKVEAVVIGVGGFLGIGKKNVAIEYDLVKIDQRDGRDVLVVKTTAEALKAQHMFDKSAYMPMPAGAEVEQPKPATAEDLADAPAKDGAAGSATGMSDSAPQTGEAPEKPVE